MSPSVNKSLFMKCLTKEEREEFLWGRQTAVRGRGRETSYGRVVKHSDFSKLSEFILVQILIRIVPRERKQRKKRDKIRKERGIEEERDIDVIFGLNQMCGICVPILHDNVLVQLTVHFECSLS